MICSASESNYGLNWLDRLRTSRGFPVGNETGLEAFLDANAPPSGQVESSSDGRSAALARSDISGESAKVRVRVKRGRVPIGRDNEDWFAILSGVLAELFNMGIHGGRWLWMTGGRPGSKKTLKRAQYCARKMGDRNAAISPQTSVSGTKDKETVELDSVHRRPRRKSRKNVLKVDKKEEGSENVRSAELDSCSCTVVTVIDSSFPGWKFGKAISRKGNDWRIREIRKSLDGNMATSDSIFRKKRRLHRRKDQDEPPICSSIASGEGGIMETAQDIRTSQ